MKSTEWSHDNDFRRPPWVSTDVWSACNQLQTYKEEIADLFVCNEALVISDGLKARIGSLTANKERFLPWRTIKNEGDKPLLEYGWRKLSKASLTANCSLTTLVISFSSIRMTAA